MKFYTSIMFNAILKVKLVTEMKFHFLFSASTHTYKYMYALSETFISSSLKYPWHYELFYVKMFKSLTGISHICHCIQIIQLPDHCIVLHNGLMSFSDKRLTELATEAPSNIMIMMIRKRFIQQFTRLHSTAITKSDTNQCYWL